MTQYPFRRLQIELSQLITSLPPESRLPSEPALARQLGVSRATLREAMRSFEGRGLIRRKQGVGTFVVAQVPVIDTGLEVLESIETLAKRINLSVRVGDLRVNQKAAGQTEAQKMNIPMGTMITSVSRVMYTDRHPIALLLDNLPVDVLPVNELIDGFSGSVLDLLLQREVPQLSTSRTEIKAIGATPEVAKALQIQRDDVLLHFEAQLYNNDGRVVDYSISHFLPGYFRFHVVRRVGSNRA
jgi:GntR family transcriptional regulator